MLADLRGSTLDQAGYLWCRHTFIIFVFCLNRFGALPSKRLGRVSQVHFPPPDPRKPLGLFLVLRAFALAQH